MEEQTLANNPIQQPPVNPAPVNKKPNHWFIAIIILGLILIVGGMYAFVLQSQKQMVPPSPEPPLPPKVTLQPSPNQDETANWKTYVDPKNHFSFKYPHDLDLTVNYNNFNLAKLTTGAEIKYSVKSGSSLKNAINPFYLTIEVWDNKNNVTNQQIKQDLLNSKPKQVGPYTTKYVSINDYKNGEIVGVYYITTGDQSEENIEEATKDKIYIFRFNSEGNPTGNETRFLIDQILSTFKFTN